MSCKVTMVMLAAVAMLGSACDKSGGDDACEDVDCGSYGTCALDASDAAYCECDTGYHADALLCVVDVVDPCEGVLCSDHGTCVVDTSDQAGCECDTGYHAEGLECVQDVVEICDDPVALREDALTNGTVILDGVALPASTPIIDINADPSTYEGTVVQIEGWVVEVCASAGCYVLLRDANNNQLRLKVVDGFINFQGLTEMGRYMIGEGPYTESGSHGPQVEIDNHGAVVSAELCTNP